KGKSETAQEFNSTGNLTQRVERQNKEITNVKKEIKRSEEEITAELNQRIGNVNADIATLNGVADSLQQKANQLESDIADKVDAEWVNGQLVHKANADSVYTKVETDNRLGDKADKSTTYTKNEVDNALNGYVATGTYIVDQQGVVTRFEDAESRISQTEQGLLSTVNKTTYQQDKTAMQGDIDSKASQTSVTALTTRMSNAETAIDQTAEAVLIKANAEDVYTKTEIDGQITTVNNRIASAEASISTQAGRIDLKANASDVYTKTQVDTSLDGKAN